MNVLIWKSDRQYLPTLPNRKDGYMRNTSKVLLTGMLLVQWTTLGAQAAVYQLDNGSYKYSLNASDGT